MIPNRFQIAIDGYYGNPLTSAPSFITELFETVADEAEMRILGIEIRNVDAVIPKGEAWVDEGGVSASALISTSHMCLHVWPNDVFFMFDLVSCRNFDPGRVRELVMRELVVRAIEREFIFPDQRVSDRRGSQHEERKEPQDEARTADTKEAHREGESIEDQGASGTG